LSHAVEIVFTEWRHEDHRALTLRPKLSKISTLGGLIFQNVVRLSKTICYVTADPVKLSEQLFQSKAYFSNGFP